MAELGDDYCRLQLYCVRLSDEVVILANGGLKTGRTVRISPICWLSSDLPTRWPTSSWSWSQPMSYSLSANRY